MTAKPSINPAVFLHEQLEHQGHVVIGVDPHKLSATIEVSDEPAQDGA